MLNACFGRTTGDFWVAWWGHSNSWLSTFSPIIKYGTKYNFWHSGIRCFDILSKLSNCHKKSKWLLSHKASLSKINKLFFKFLNVLLQPFSSSFDLICVKSFFLFVGCRLFNVDVHRLNVGCSDVVEYSVGQSDSWLLGRRDQSIRTLKNLK